MLQDEAVGGPTWLRLAELTAPLVYAFVGGVVGHFLASRRQRNAVRTEEARDWRREGLLAIGGVRTLLTSTDPDHLEGISFDRRNEELGAAWRQWQDVGEGLLTAGVAIGGRTDELARELDRDMSRYLSAVTTAHELDRPPPPAPQGPPPSVGELIEALNRDPASLPPRPPQPGTPQEIESAWNDAREHHRHVDRLADDLAERIRSR